MKHIIGYRGDIDGLRAIAVIAVVIFHINPEILKGGFIGVDIFFVISGFLITSIIQKQLANNTFSLSQFYAKRVKRLMPAILVMLITVLVLSYFLIFFAEWEDISSQALMTLFGLANIEMWKYAQDYWGPQAENSPFLHMWSLSVEEQFYLIYPIILYLLFYKYKLNLAKWTIIIVILSFTLSFLATFYAPAASFYFFRYWELGIGVLLAIYLNKKNDTEAKPYNLSWLGLIIIILSYFMIDEAGFPGWKVLMPILGTIFIIISTAPSITTKLLCSKVLTQIGRYSYSIYIWHWPIILFSKKWSEKNQEAFPYFFIICMIIVIAVASYYLIENRFRYGGKKTYIMISIVFVIAVMLSLALDKISPKYNKSNYQLAVSHLSKYNVLSNDLRESHSIGITKYYNSRRNIELMVFGDSHGLMWANTINEIAKELELGVSFYTADGDMPIFTEEPKKTASSIYNANLKYHFAKTRYKSLKENQPKVLFIISRWSGHIKFNGLKVQNIESFIQFINSITPDTQIILMSEPPLLFFGDNQSIDYLSWTQTEKSELSIPYIEHENYEQYEKRIKQMLKQFPYVHYIDIRSNYELKNQQVKFLSNNELLYIDDDHLSEAGARKSKNLIKSVVQNLIKN